MTSPDNKPVELKQIYHHSTGGTSYIGRFAPSPTGPLHFGSLVSAIGSYLDARLHQGQWLVRIEDLDKPRTLPGAVENILTTLQALDMHWNQEIVYQSQRLVNYQTAFQQLQAKQLIYGCCCTRKEIADSLFPHQRHMTPIYPGICRHGLPQGKTARAWRILTTQAPIKFADHAAGTLQENLAQEVGDFILKRADGTWAYQLAVVIDDAAANVTHIVRGADLLTSTPRQIYLQKCLNLSTPYYWHLPLVIGSNGEKLSKQNGAQALDLTHPITQLNNALNHFGLPTIDASNFSEFWPKALIYWANYRQSICRT